MGSQDNPKRLSGYVFWINVLWKLGFFSTAFFSPGSCQDARVLECPAVFRNGENLIYCTANTTAITEAGCTGIGAIIRFQITLPGQSPASMCDANFNTCDTTFNSDNCRCVSHVSALKRYELNFTGDSSVHTNGSFDCIINCLGSTLPPTVKDPSCDRFDFTAPTTAGPNTTTETETPPTSDQGCPICKKGTDCDEPDLLCLLFLLLLIPIAVVIIIVWYFFCHNGGINATKKAEGGELESLPQDQQTTNGNKPANGNGCGQRDNKAGTGHVAPNGAS